jgi:hypothetical protein
MSQKTDYTDTEWDTLQQLPLMIGMAVAGSSVSGVSGVLNEAVTTSKVMLEAKKAGGLLGEIADSTGNPDVRKSLNDAAWKPMDLKTKTLDACRQAVGIVTAKGTTEELASFREMMIDLATKVAQASKEGGFFGFGGVQVSDSERAALAEISSALGTVQEVKASVNEIT